MEEVELHIYPDGRLIITVRGVKGGKCVDLTKPLEEALGGAVETRSYSSEYYEQALGRPRQQA
jgi:hypothetical protein